MANGLTRWPHAPAHFFDARGGTYVVTSATCRKQHHFNSRAKLDLLQQAIFDFAERNGVALEAWAVFSNHYHLVARLPQPAKLATFVNRLHSFSSRKMNDIDGTPERRVWYQYWETRLTYEKSYLLGCTTCTATQCTTV
jgi:putative transposase